MLLAADACYTQANLQEGVLPGLMWSAEETVRSVERMRHLQQAQGVRIITGHDPDMWESLRSVPYYE